MHASLSREDYDALVEEASRKLNEAYEKLPARPGERELLDKVRRASDGQLKRIMEMLEED